MKSVLGCVKSASLLFYRHLGILLIAAAFFMSLSFVPSFIVSFFPQVESGQSMSGELIILMTIYSTIVFLCMQSLVLSLSLGLFRRAEDIFLILLRPFTFRLIPLLIILAVLMMASLFVSSVLVIAALQKATFSLVIFTPVYFLMMSLILILGFSYLDQRASFFQTIKLCFKTIKKIGVVRIIGLNIIVISALSALFYLSTLLSDFAGGLTVDFAGLLSTYMANYVSNLSLIFGLLSFSELYCSGAVPVESNVPEPA